jgi:NAD(P)-dependent dehydrogenase (short-subunit alcohol dehydrogenase family)
MTSATNGLAGRLAGKTALVTGVSPNVTAGIAYGFADAGARVFCVDIREDFAQGCAAGIRARGGAADGFACDVTDEPGVIRAVDAAAARYGGIDILLNGVAISRPFGLLDIEVGEFRRQIDCILTGALLFTKHVAKRMIDAKTAGSILNLGSTEGHQGNPGNIAYGTGKSGLTNFTRAAAMELAPFGIRVNLLTPTGTDASEGHARAAEWKVDWKQSVRSVRRPDFSTGAEGVPLGRQPLPSDYAGAAVFLASDESRMITGTDLQIDGGVLSRYWRWSPGSDRARQA